MRISIDFGRAGTARLPEEAYRRPQPLAARLEQMLGEEPSDAAPGGGVSFLTELKADPGQVGLETLLKEAQC